MKTVIVGMLLASFVWACQSGSRATHQEASQNPYASFRNLGDALRGMGGLYVSGTGTTRKVTLQRAGVMSTGPLYVLNGFPLGTDYQRANHAVNMAEVKSIRLLRSVSELAQYGAQSNGGVLLISTVTAKDMRAAIKLPEVTQVGRKTLDEQ